jgi:hypothetical protein
MVILVSSSPIALLNQYIIGWDIQGCQNEVLWFNIMTF